MRKQLTFSTIVLVSALLLFSLSGASAQSESKAAFQSVISAQVRAFQSDDWSKAFSYASPTIKTMFGSVERFREMVMGGYQAVARPSTFEFEEVITVQGRPTQRAFIVGPNGQAYQAYYFMQQQQDGEWRIDGVSLTPITDLTS